MHQDRFHATGATPEPLSGPRPTSRPRPGIRPRSRPASLVAALTTTLILAVGLVGACAPPTPAPSGSQPVGVDQAAPQLPLWEVAHPAGTVYILGSVHLLRPEVYPLDDAIYEAFDEAATVAFELDFGEMAAAAPAMMQRGTFQDGRTLADILPADMYADLEARAAGLGLPMQAVDRMTPWLAAMTFSSVVLTQGGFDAATGLDLHLHERAVAAGQPVVGLETMEEQIEVFEGLSLEDQIAFLGSTLDHLDDTVAELDEATVLWLAGDTHGLADMFVESMADQPHLMDRLLYERNRNWIPQIEAFMATGETVIVVVGMGHLVGEGSVIDLLRRRGHQVTQVPGSRAPI